MIRGFRRQPVAASWPSAQHALGLNSWLRIAWSLIAVGMALGVAGFFQAGGGSVGDNLYDAVRLLAFDVDERPGGVPALLEVGRWLAAAGAAMLAYEGVVRVFPAEIERRRARRRSDHVVVAGLGDYGSHLALAFLKPKDPAERLDVTGIELDPAAPGAGSLRAAGGLVLEGDAADRAQRLLEQARVDRARYLVVTAGDDGRNVDIAKRAGELVGQRHTALTAFVHLDDLRLWPRLKARVVSTRGDRPYRIEFFNVFECGARILLQRHPPFPRGAAAPVDQILLFGFGGLGEQVLLHIAQRWHGERGDRVDRVPITVVAPDATRRLAAVLRRHPRLDDVASFDAHDSELDLTPSEAQRLLDDVPAGIAYVCAEHDAEGAAAALALHPAARSHGVPLVVVLDQEDRGFAGALRKDGRTLPGLSVFGLVSRALPPDLLVRGTNEILAYAKHEHYLAMEQARGVDAAANPSATSWDELPPSLKESNRAFADRIGEKLERASCVLVPDLFATGREQSFAFEPDEVEELAREEHERWCADLRRDGWSYGEVKDPRAKKHNLLVPWDDLPEAEREKDREPVRALPEFVARAGFAIVRAEPPERELVSGAAAE